MIVDKDDFIFQSLPSHLSQRVSSSMAPKTRAAAPKASTGDKRKREKKDSPKDEAGTEDKPEVEADGSVDQVDEGAEDANSDGETHSEFLD